MQDLERRAALWQRLSRQGTLDARRATLAEIDFISDNIDFIDGNEASLNEMKQEELHNGRQ